MWTPLQVRPSRHDTVGGVPDVLFQLPEESGAFDGSVPVFKDKILEMESKCAYEEEENVFQEYFHYGRQGASVSVKPWRSTLFIFSTHKYGHNNIKTIYSDQ